MSLKQTLLFIIALLIFKSPLAAEPLDYNELTIDPENAVTISGFVINPEGIRVVGAVIEIVETGQSVVSDGNGFFTFPAVFRGLITLRASSHDYEPVVSPPIDLSEGVVGPLVVSFERVRTFESTIVVTATRSERLLSDVPVRTEVITSESIERKAAATLAEILDATTGLRVENNCQNCGFSSLRINGLEGAYAHVLVNGMDAFSSLASVYGLEHIPAIFVDRVEVVKGGGSALYGAGAVGGVVNVITKQPTRTAASLEAYYGNMGGEDSGDARGWGSWVGNQGRTAMLAFGNMSRHSGYDRNDDGFTDVARKRLESGGVHFFQRALHNAAELRVGLAVTHEDRRGGDNLQLSPEQTEVTEWIESWRCAYTAQWIHNLSGSSYYRMQLSHVRTDRDTYYGGGFDPNAYGETSNPHTNLALSFGHIVGAHNLLFGFQYIRDEMTDSHPGYDRLLSQTYDNYGFFLQDDFKIGDMLTLLAGGRVDKHSELSDAVFSPRLSAMIKANDSFRIRGTVSFGFRPPVVFDEDLHILISGGEPQFIYNDPDLREERAVSLSLSGEYSSIWEGELSTRFEANFFYTRLEDTFVLDEIGGECEGAMIFQRINGGGAKVYGVELNADLDFPGGFDIEAGLTFQRSRLDEPEPDFGSEYFFRTPDTYGYLMASYSCPRFFINGTLEYTGEMWAPHYAGYIDEDVLERTPGFAVFNMRVGMPLLREPFGLTLIANVFNITDDFQGDLDMGPNRDSGYIYGPRRPRTFLVGLKLDI